MAAGDDEDVARGVGEGVEAEEAGGPADQQVRVLFGVVAGHAVRDGVVHGGDHVAEDAMRVFGAGVRPGAERGGNTGAGGVLRRG